MNGTILIYSKRYRGYFWQYPDGTLSARRLTEKEIANLGGDDDETRQLAEYNRHHDR